MEAIQFLLLIAVVIVECAVPLVANEESESGKTNMSVLQEALMHAGVSADGISVIRMFTKSGKHRTKYRALYLDKQAGNALCLFRWYVNDVTGVHTPMRPRCTGASGTGSSQAAAATSRLPVKPRKVGRQMFEAGQTVELDPAQPYPGETVEIDPASLQYGVPGGVVVGPYGVPGGVVGPPYGVPGGFVVGPYGVPGGVGFGPYGVPGGVVVGPPYGVPGGVAVGPGYNVPEGVVVGPGYTVPGGIVEPPGYVVPQPGPVVPRPGPVMPRPGPVRIPGAVFGPPGVITYLPPGYACPPGYRCPSGTGVGVGSITHTGYEESEKHKNENIGKIEIRVRGRTPPPTECKGGCNITIVQPPSGCHGGCDIPIVQPPSGCIVGECDIQVMPQPTGCMTGECIPIPPTVGYIHNTFPPPTVRYRYNTIPPPTVRYRYNITIPTVSVGKYKTTMPTRKYGITTPQPTIRTGIGYNATMRYTTSWMRRTAMTTRPPSGRTSYRTMKTPTLRINYNTTRRWPRRTRGG